MIRNLLRVAFAAAALAFLVSAPRAQATNDGDYVTTYYDQYQQVVGTYEEDCDHVETYDGVQDGTWKWLHVTSCSTIGSYDEYYHKCNGVWVRVGFVGSTAC